MLGRILLFLTVKMEKAFLLWHDYCVATRRPLSNAVLSDQSKRIDLIGLIREISRLGRTSTQIEISSVETLISST